MSIRYSVDYDDLFADEKVMPRCDLQALHTTSTTSTKSQIKQFIHDNHLKRFLLMSKNGTLDDNDVQLAIQFVIDIFKDKGFQAVFESDNLSRIICLYEQLDPSRRVLISTIIQEQIASILSNEKDINIVPPLLVHLPMRFIRGEQHSTELELLPFFKEMYDFAWRMSLVSKPRQWFAEQCCYLIEKFQEQMKSWPYREDTGSTWRSLRVYTLSLFRITYPNIICTIDEAKGFLSKEKLKTFGLLFRE